VSVPLYPDGVTCGRLSDSLVEVKVSPPNASVSSFVVDSYEVTYKSIIASYPLTVTHDVAYTNDNQTANDTLTNATAGVTYNILVRSRAGHLTSRSVKTSCTAGQLALSAQQALLCSIRLSGSVQRNSLRNNRH